MSANNWAICPKCKQEQDKKLEKLQQNAKEAYGKVSQEQYLSMLEQIGNWEEQELDSTLREDWELGTDEDGILFIRYSCSCTKCRFVHEFKHEKSILP